MCHPSLVDAKFVADQGDFLMRSVKVRFQANSGLAAQPRVWAMVNWARLITCKIADLTREAQLLGNGRVGDDDFAGMRSSRRLLEKDFLKPTINQRCITS